MGAGWIASYLSSSVGKKNIMALTGAGLVIFLLGHMAGHLIMFGGRDAYNTYAEAMQANPLLWPARLGLLAVFFVHMALAFALTAQNRAARPVAYAKKNFQEASVASRTMINTGIVIFFFLLYHLAHFTLFWVQDTGPYLDDQGRHDVYTRMVDAFHNPIVFITYALALVALTGHLIHGIRSMFQSLGLNHERYNWLIKVGSLKVAGIIIVGFLAVPVAIVIGVIS